MKETILQETESSFSELYRVLNLFTEAQMNMVPFESSWTAGQVAEHIIKATSGMKRLCNGPTESTSRPADEKINAIKGMFLDYSVKMQSPANLVPTDAEHDKKAALVSLEAIEKDIREVAETHDLSLICLGFELPGFGKFTKFEWLSFTLIHMQRHTNQLKRIYEGLSA
jgi:hypothetical protein